MNTTTENPLKMNFWQYLVHTYKKSGMIILQGFIVALYVSITSIYANKMEFEELTMYNAMFTIAYYLIMKTKENYKKNR